MTTPLPVPVTVVPGVFDWVSLAIAVFASLGALAVTIVIWRQDRSRLIREKESSELRRFAEVVRGATDDQLLVVFFRDVPWLYENLRPGSDALISYLRKLVEWGRDGSMDRHIDLPVEVSNAAALWEYQPATRADWTEVFLANGAIELVAEDNLRISPDARRRVQTAILEDARFRRALRGTRLSRLHIRWELLRNSLPSALRTRVSHVENAFATRDPADCTEAGNDAWLRALVLDESDC